MVVIQIGHKKRQGKDTFAEFLTEHAESRGLKVGTLSFATALKEIMADTLGISIETLNILKNDSEHYRAVLQRFGSGKIKEYFGDTVWRDITAKQVEALREEGYDLVIIPDFRFSYELIDGAITYNVVRDRSYKGDHISETALDDYPYDTIIHNTGTLEELSRMASNTIKVLFKG